MRKDRIEVKKPDLILLTIVAILVLFGLVIIASVSTAFSQVGSSTFFLFRYIFIGLLPGVFLGFLAFKIPLDFLRKWVFLILLVNLILMILVFVPKIGMSSGGASRWLDFGVVSLQPSEFLKLTFILYLAAWLPNIHQKKSIKNFSVTLVAFLIIIGLISLLLALQSDVGTLGIIIISATLMYFLANTPAKHTLFVLMMGLAVFSILIKIEQYRLNRIIIFIRPDTEPMGMGYQIQQSLITIGSGGIWGKGLGMSVQKFGFLPHVMTDSIFAIFSEELGFIGGLILILLFLIFVWRAFGIAKRTPEKFHQLICLGVSIWICLQAFINIGAIAGLLPLTGIPLPFMSYGGSALVAELIGVGLLLNISKNI